MSEPLTDKQIEQIRRDVAKAYHDLMIDLAMKGEGQVGNRRFWRDEDNVIRWEDLPDGAVEGAPDPVDPAPGDGHEEPVPTTPEPARKGSRAQRNRRAAVIRGQVPAQGNARDRGVER